MTVVVALALTEALIIFLVVVAESRLPGAPGTGFGVLTAKAVTLAACGLAAFYLDDLYDLRRLRRFRQFAARLPQSVVYMALLATAAKLAIPGLEIGWRSLATIVASSFVPIVILRLAVHHVFAGHPFSRRVLVLGTTPLAGKLVREILDEPALREVVVGVVDDGTGAFVPGARCLRLGSIDGLASVIEAFEPDLIVDALEEPHDPLVAQALVTPRARGVAIEGGLSAYERLTGKIAIEWATPRDVLFAREFPVSRVALTLGRAISFLVASCAVVALAPLFLLVALLIKLDSRGPIFFHQARVGLGGKPFDLIKFRTMHPGVAVSEWADDNTHRTTRVGRWLRRFRIDELPQFLNILQGDMNLVGPRPHPVSNLALFNAEIPYYGLRCSARPGITGWAQIRYGYAGNLEQETEKMRYDLHYIQHMSLALDVRILLETVKVIFTGGRSSEVDEQAVQASPIYFGIERPGGFQRARRAEAKHELLSFEARRGKGSRTQGIE